MKTNFHRLQRADPEAVKKYYSEAYEYEPLPRQSYAHFLNLLGATEGKKILDIACGTGILLEEAERRGLECYGVDISTRAIQVARTRTRANLKCANVDNGLDYPEGFFDYVTCLGSLEHFQNQPKVIQEIYRVAKGEACICIYVPNDDYLLHKFGYETDSQPIVSRYSLKKWEQLLETNGLKIERVYKDNSHLLSLNVEGKGLKRFPKIVFKLLVKPLVPFLQLKLSYCFIFICRKKDRD